MKRLIRPLLLLLLVLITPNAVRRIAGANGPQFSRPKLVASGAVGAAQQGASVALSADGNTAIVGAYADNNFAGAAWIWTRTYGIWLQGPKLVASNSIGNAYQGFSVALSADGNTALVGGYWDNNLVGAAWVWTRDTAGIWIPGPKLVGTGAAGQAGQGFSVSLSADGTTALVGGPYDSGSYLGAAWVWAKSGGVWTQEGSKLKGTGFYQGDSVSLSANGDTAIIGAHGGISTPGSASIWTRSGGGWTQQGPVLDASGASAGSAVGYCVSLSADGDTAIAGGFGYSNSTGAVWIWTRSAGIWTEQARLVGSGALGASKQGFSVSLSAGGNTAAVGAYEDNGGVGATWVWTRTGTVWTETDKLIGPGRVGASRQGASVSLSADGNTLIAGGYGDNGNAGAAWVFTVNAPPTFNLVWSDEFNGPIDTGVDTALWQYDTGTSYPGGPSNWGTGEVETMSNSTANVYQDGVGHLAIRPLHTGSMPTSGWTSGRIETVRTDFQPPPGGVLAVEASLQLPNISGSGAAGYWPAFWMLGAPYRGNYFNWPGIGEIDIVESVNGLSSTFATLHCGSAPGGPCNEFTGISSGQRSCSGCQTGFHTYRVEFDKSASLEQIRWYLDGTNYFTVNSNQVDATTWSNATNHGFFVILDLAIGGSFPGAFGGGPTASTVSGVPMLVDYVRVYVKQNLPATVFGITPTSSVRGAAVSAAISGTNLWGATAVQFSGTGVTGALSPGATDTNLPLTITVAPDAIPGIRTFDVVTSGGVSATFSGFTVNGPPPAITSIMPLLGPQGGVVSATITGSGLTGATAVTFSGTGVTAVIGNGGTDSSLPLTITISGSAALGSRTLTITASGVTSAAFSGFTVTLPKKVGGQLTSQ